MMRILVFALSLVVLFGVVACEKEKPQKVIKKTTKVVAKKKAPEVIEKVEVLEENAFHYQADGRRDPFVSLLEIREPIEETVEPETPLQTFGLKELKLIAIVIGQGEPRAMVVAPDKKAYTLAAGVKVGRNQGVVQRVTESEVVVEEHFRDFSGGLKTEIKKITLPQGEGE